MADSALKEPAEPLMSLRALAAEVLEAKRPLPSLLERLAELAKECAHALRLEDEVKNAALAERLQAALNSFPNLEQTASVSLSSFSIESLERLEAIAVDAMAAAEARKAADIALAEAVAARDYKAVSLFASSAHTASESEATANTEARAWMSANGFLPRPAPELSPALPSSEELDGEEKNSVAQSEPLGTVDGGELAGEQFPPPMLSTEPSGDMPHLPGDDGDQNPMPTAEPVAPEPVMDVAYAVGQLSATTARDDKVPPPNALLPGLGDAVTEHGKGSEPRPISGRSAIIDLPLATALASGRLGLAEALLETGEHAGSAPLLNAAIGLAALALVADGSGQVDDRAGEVVRQILELLPAANGDDDVAVSLGLILPAATTLTWLAPSCLPGTLLQAALELDVVKSPSALIEAARIVVNAPIVGATLASAPQVMAALVSQEAWEKDFKSASQEIADWQISRISRKFRFAAATDVWQAAMRPSGFLGLLLSQAAQAQYERAPAILETLRKIDIESELRTVEKQARGIMAAQKAKIEGPAWRELLSLTEEAVTRLEHWGGLAGLAPSRKDAAHLRPIADLRTKLLGSVIAAVQNLSGPADAGLATAGVAAACLARLQTLLEGGVPARAAGSADELLGRDLMPLSSVRFDIDWTRQRPLPRVLNEQLSSVALAAAPEAEDTAQRRIEEADYIGAQLAIDLVEPEAVRGRLLRDLRNSLGRRRAEEISSLEEVRAQIEEAERAGRVETGEAQEWLERLSRCRETLEDAEPAEAEVRFAGSRQLAEQARLMLTAGESAVRQRIANRIEQLGRLVEGERDRIVALVEQGQFALAEDLVERLADGDLLERAQPMLVEQAFTAFFPRQADELAGWIKQQRAAMAGIAEGRLALPIEFLSPSMTVSPDSVAIAKAWTDCVREPRQTLQNGLLRLFEGLGFTDPGLHGFQTPRSGVSEMTCQLHVRPLRDRDTAILPQFGSEANGTYRLLCLWRKRDEDDVRQALASAQGGGMPTIVMLFSPLDAEQRRRLAALARAGKLPAALVIDETLVMHLAHLQGARLPALFACTLPFTDTRPWADTGTPAPEMFFGRARELRAVEARGGDFTHLIYGGRQLGKTAVLRQVERVMGSVPETIARYVSIAHIGLSQPITELWPRLAEELAGASVSLSPTDGEREVRRAVRDWLEAKKERRILLLLDEADAFFTRDREAGFAVTSALRDLSVETDRRFKPVFAGLRNVQKLASDPNSPLAHLGMPLVVGPLLRGEERRQAEELVRWPFAALGYNMDDAVVTRILAFANYYPSLIQVVCQRLLHSLRLQSSASGPPWTVRMDDVVRVLETPEVRTEAFKRFGITLDLDQRYKLLALLVAQFSIDDPHTLAVGIERGLLRDLASAAWPSGFPILLNEDSFEGLLDEMVGLGLLRASDGTRYALRSANLAHLIGTRLEIRDQIQAFAKRPAEDTVDPLDLRRSGEKDWPGLFTFRQEGQLLAAGGSVAVIAGTKLAGIDSWEGAVKATCQFARDRHKLKMRSQVLGKPYTFESFIGLLSDAGRKPLNEPMVCVVPAAAKWTSQWVVEARQRLDRRSKDKAPIRVLFVADAQRALDWVSDAGRPAALAAGEAGNRVLELTAGPWHRADTTLWADRQQVGLSPEAVIAATGGWDFLLRRLANAPQKERSKPIDALARYLVSKVDGTVHFLDDIFDLPDARAILQALADCEEGRVADEVVDARSVTAYAGGEPLTIERILEWAEIVGLVSRGADGLVLCQELKLALGMAPAELA